MALNEQLALLGEKIEFPGLAFDADGTLGLKLDDGTALEMSQDADRNLLHVCSPIGAIPASGAEGLSSLLRRDLRGSVTYAPAYAVDFDTRQVVLSLSLPADAVTADLLAEIIEDFAKVVQGERRWLATI